MAAQERINRISLDQVASTTSSGDDRTRGGDMPVNGVGTRHEEETSGAPSGECLASVEPCIASR